MTRTLARFPRGIMEIHRQAHTVNGASRATMMSVPVREQDGQVGSLHQLIAIKICGAARP